MKPIRRLSLATVAAAALGMAMASAPAWADAPVQTQPTPPSENVTVNLIRLLVKQGVITQEAGNALLAQAEADAAKARAANAANVQVAAQTAPPPPAEGVVRVPYVPQVVRDQIRDEIKQQVMTEARNEGWAQPDTLPEWIGRIQLSGDLRVRGQGDLYSSNNTDEEVDFAAFNANGPTDINPYTNPNGIPFLNTRRDRNTFNFRARIGLQAQVSDQVTAGIRLATGQTNSPVSTNQALGGGLSKKDLWLDQAYVSIKPFGWADLTLGRMADPYVHTDLVFDDDLNFDGVAARVRTRSSDEEGLAFSGVLGAFPLDYASYAFPTNSTAKSANEVKWLFGGQLAMNYRHDTVNFRTSVAYYDFSNVAGRLSAPCALYNGNKQCSSDFSRPSFMQKGNTLFLIRNILPDPSNPLNYAQAQFAGLSFDYNLLDLTADLDWKIGERYHLGLSGDFVRNLAFKKSDICKSAPLGMPVNNVQPGVDAGGVAVNFNPCSPPPAGVSAAVLQSGPTGWLVKGTFGDPTVRAAGKWNLTMGYRYVEPDAVVDGFTDSDFHLGGTNARGYFVAGSVGVSDNTWITARWLSANAVFGPPLAIDVAQIDLNIGF